MPLTHIPEFNKLVMKDLTSTQIGAIVDNFIKDDDVVGEINDSHIVNLFLGLLKMERPYSVYLSASTNLIADFTNVVQLSSNKWLPLIRFKHNEMGSLLEMKNISTKSITGSITELMQVDPHTISILTKENETPQAGNVDLLNDTYLTRSEREESSFAAQESNKTGSNIVEEELSHLNDAVALKTFFEYAASIKNYMEEWIKDFDLKYLTI